MWLGAFVGIFQENVSLSEMRSGITVFQKVCLKMKIQTVVGLRERTYHGNDARRLGEHRQKEEGCQSIIVTIPEDGRVRAREDEKVEKYQDLASDVRGMCAVRTRVIIGILSLKGESCIVFVFKRN